MTQWKFSIKWIKILSCLLLCSCSISDNYEETEVFQRQDFEAHGCCGFTIYSEFKLNKFLILNGDYSYLKDKKKFTFDITDAPEGFLVRIESWKGIKNVDKMLYCTDLVDAEKRKVDIFYAMTGFVDLSIDSVYVDMKLTSGVFVNDDKDSVIIDEIWLTNVNIEDCPG